jgi:hypothetical protein
MVVVWSVQNAAGLCGVDIDPALRWLDGAEEGWWSSGR